MSIQNLIRKRFFPHIWCPGCGHGIILNGLLHAIDDLGIPQEKISLVSGIGCSARISGYVDFHSMHTTKLSCKVRKITKTLMVLTVLIF